jgi:hypothetical protein
MLKKSIKSLAEQIIVLRQYLQYNGDNQINEV